MSKLNKIVFIVAAFVCGTFALASCSSTANNTTNGNTAVVTSSGASNSTASTSGNTSSGTTTASTSGDKIGVAECDEYIEKYEACINSKVPEAQRAMLKGPFESQRKAFKEAAATPQGKAGLATGCKQAIQTAKQSTTAWGCAW